MKNFIDSCTQSELPNLLIHPSYKKFNYSDGTKEEDKVFNILKETKDKSLYSEELHSAITDWVTEYHFSQARHNLLRHINIKKSDNILELGAGCGAITRQLGETGAKVLAIEGSLKRAKCLALRTSDLPNVKNICSDFQRIDWDKEFDIVTLIGVLEYTPMYFKENTPFITCLNLVKKVLKPDGKLILAIENQLGLKYFMGYSEDHYGKPYIGIQNLYPSKNAKTLGRYKLKNLLKKCGFKSIEFQYPFPDYKIPSVILTQKAFEVNKFAPEEIIAQLKSRDYLSNFSSPYVENLVWENLAQNHLIPELSNSFLVIAGLQSVKNKEKNPLLAVSYNLDRKKEYKTETKFILNNNHQIKVIKKKLMPEILDKSQVIKIKNITDKYIYGTNMSTLMLKSLLKEDINQFYNYCNKWIDYAKKYGLKNSTRKSIKSSIKPEYIDCIPSNLVINKNNIDYIDREWIYKKPYNLELLIVRGLYQFQTANSLNDFLVENQSDFYKLTHAWLKNQKIILTKTLINEFIKTENEICDVVYGEKVWQPIRGLKESKRVNYIEKKVQYLFSKTRNFLIK